MKAHCNPRHVEARKRFVSLAFIDNANTRLPLVNIDDLFLLLLYEDDTCCNGRPTLRLGGYCATRTLDGVQWGGAANCRLLKTLTLAPQYGARNERIDRSKLELLALALKLDRRLSRAARYPSFPWPDLRLPQLWVGYRARHTGELTGEGPEFERACRLQSVAPVELFCNSARQIDGLVTYPLDWVNGQLESAVAIFAELTLGVRRQVCRVGTLPDGLIGYHGASAFDFYNSRFRNWAGRRWQLSRKALVKAIAPKCNSAKSRTSPADVYVA
jgi:hypothetical protein